jgi:hypothetical protein
MLLKKLGNFRYLSPGIKELEKHLKRYYWKVA